MNDANAGASGSTRAKARIRWCNAIGKLVMGVKSVRTGRVGQVAGRNGLLHWCDDPRLQIFTVTVKLFGLHHFDETTRAGR
jgi:type IV secretory pathway VirJ component